MLPGCQENTETVVTTNQALRALVQLLARQVARECFSASSPSTLHAAFPGDSEQTTPHTDEGGCHEH